MLLVSVAEPRVAVDTRLGLSSVSSAMCHPLRVVLQSLVPWSGARAKDRSIGFSPRASCVCSNFVLYNSRPTSAAWSERCAPLRWAPVPREANFLSLSSSEPSKSRCHYARRRSSSINFHSFGCECERKHATFLHRHASVQAECQLCGANVLRHTLRGESRARRRRYL